MSVDVLLSLGGNMGDRKAIMDSAVARLNALPGTSVRARSSYYRTEPVGPVAQEWYVNLAVALASELSHGDLFVASRAIEAALGRDRSKEISWGPRPIDIDVVSYDGSPPTDDRAFVVIPLAEIAPRRTIDGTPLEVLAVDLAGDDVTKLDWPVPRV
jgi:2-amino-4-hydroxy-6-hydroxymethyldihydropteridine diphosphokinase